MTTEITNAVAHAISNLNATGDLAALEQLADALNEAEEYLLEVNDGAAHYTTIDNLLHGVADLTDLPCSVDSSDALYDGVYASTGDGQHVMRCSDSSSLPDSYRWRLSNGRLGWNVESIDD